MVWSEAVPLVVCRRRGDAPGVHAGAVGRSSGRRFVTVGCGNRFDALPLHRLFLRGAEDGRGLDTGHPQGEPFYASGIDTVAPDGSGTDQTTGQCPYCQTVAADFPNLGAWAPSTVSQLRSWGFNSLGGYSDDADLGSQMPYEVQLSMASGDDWFAPSFVTNADQVAATQVAPLANDPNVIGYFTDSELDWGPYLGDSAVSPRPLCRSTCSCRPGRPVWLWRSSMQATRADF